MDLEFNQNGVEIRILDGPYLQAGHPTVATLNDYTVLAARLDELKGFAAEKLLALYNENWREDGAPEIDCAGFTERLDRPAIHLYDEIGAAVVYFGDGNLFAGHQIEVHVDDGVPTYTGILG